MAARKNRIHPDPQWVERIRQSIEAGMLVKHLKEHVKGERKLESSQVTAATALLKKVLPDLAAVELSGEVNTHVTAIERRIVRPSDRHG